MSSSSPNHNDYVERLESKISEQARELSELYSQSSKNVFLKSNEAQKDNKYVHQHNSLSETAQKMRLQKNHSQQIDALQKQLDLTELRLSEHVRSKKKLMHDMDSKTREAIFFEKQCSELQSENQSLKAQLDSTLRISSIAGAKSRGIRSTTPTRSSSSVQHSITRDEFMELKRLLEVSQKETQHHKEIENKLRLEIKILNGALEFRSDEIGMSGHADLIVKVTKLRGEVTALRRELDDKQSLLLHVEEDKSQLNSQHADLQTQLVSVQQRLAQTEADTYRLRHTDVGNSLKLVEAERDTLQLYMDNDLFKSTQLTRQIEHLESDLRMSRQSESATLEQMTSLSEALETNLAKTVQLEEALSTESIRAREFAQANTLLRADKETISRQLERKTLEAEELNKMQLNTFVQLRGREDELLNKNDSMSSLRSKLQEAEATLPHLQTENKNLRERLSFTEHELSATRDSLSTIEPRLSRIEPEWTRLRSERDAWHAEKMDMLNELVRLRPLERQLGDIGRDLSETLLAPISDDDGEAKTSPSRDAHPVLQTPVKQSLTNHHSTLSQQHSMWIGLPSVRNLHPVLYERIRSLATDLHRQESQSLKLQSALGITEQQLQRIEKDNMSLMTQLSQSQESSINSIKSLTLRAKVAEEKVSENQSATITLDQVRLMLRSYPGSVADLYPGDVSVERSRYTSEHFINSITDYQLPDFIGRVMQHNSSAVIGLSESNSRMTQLQLDHGALSVKYAALVKEHRELEGDLVDKTEKLQSSQNKLRGIDADHQKEFQKGADLVEQQNVFISTLQNSIKEEKRTILLKDAQIKTQIDQLAASRTGLYELARDLSSSTGGHVPSDAVEIPELLEFLADALHLPSRLRKRGDFDLFQSLTRHHQRCGEQGDFRQSMLANSSTSHHINYANYGSKSAPAAWVSPEKFVHQYSSGGSGGSDSKRRPDSTRKKKASSGGSPVSNGKGKRSPSQSRNSHRHDNSGSSEEHHHLYSGTSRAQSRSPPVAVSRIQDVAQQRNYGDSRHLDQRRNVKSSPPPSQSTTGSRLSYSSRDKLIERNNNARMALASLRE